jgi:hypothetical protein
MNREDFIWLFMWGLQLDPDVNRIARDPRKVWRGSYWTCVILSFLDKLGERLDFKTDREGLSKNRDNKTKRSHQLDMVWTKEIHKDFPKSLIFIEHENSISNIEVSIERLQGISPEYDKEADIRVLITYPKEESKPEILLKKFAEEDERNLVIWYPEGKFPKKRPHAPLDLTGFRTFPESLADEVKNKPGFRLLV